jgi:hypothetical protein
MSNSYFDKLAKYVANGRRFQCESEFHLRCRTPPYYLVVQIAPQYSRAVEAALEGLRKEYPESYAAALLQWKVYAPKSRTWHSVHEASRRVAIKAAEALRQNQIPSPSIVPSECKADAKGALDSTESLVPPQHPDEN